MVKGLMLRVLTSSGALLLLLLATTTTTTTLLLLVQPVGAASSDTLEEECSTEIAACEFDATCSSCVTASSNNAERLQCHTFYTLTTSSRGCDTNMDAACCLDETSEFDCLDNDEFVEYFGCLLEALGCSDEITCDNSVDGATSTATFVGLSASKIVGFSCMMFLVLLPLLWV